MKSLTEIKALAEWGDYEQVARMCDVSRDLVQRVISNERKDRHNIQLTFSQLLEFREELKERNQKSKQSWDN
jgi:hypothetical protein